MKNFDLISRSVSGSPEGAAAFMMEIFILGFNLAVECMETGDMAPDAAVLERYFVWFLEKESDAADPFYQMDPNTREHAARTKMAEIQMEMNNEEHETASTAKEVMSSVRE